MRLSLFVAAVATLAGSSVNARRQKLNTGYGPPTLDDSKLRSVLIESKVQNLDVKPKKPVRATFQQLIDHNRPSLGTFSQRYWYSDEFYAGPGSPIVLLTPGEVAADGYEFYATNSTLSGVFAQTNGGAAIVLEHRYYGQSSPYQNLTTETLQYLTLDQAIQDLVYFAKNVRLPFDPQGSSKPDKAPWILTGGSYPGALAAWTHDLAPGTFWAYHATSAPVQTKGVFWEYFAPVDEALPRNCSADFKRISAHLQEVLTTAPRNVRHQLKSKFGLEPLADDDFAGALMEPLGVWQDQQFYSGYGNIFQMCDYIE
ncbi:hypothetical protein E4U43_006429, partial [Claviceps pusilla]